MSYKGKQLENWAKMNRKTIWWALPSPPFYFVVDDKMWAEGRYLIGPFLTIKEAEEAGSFMGWQKL